MEIFELRYFLAVARRENVHRAAEDLSVSPSALTKAVARLDAELGVRLFERVRRNIRLTADGLALKSRAEVILSLEEAARHDLGRRGGAHLQGGRGAPKIRIAGPEILLAKVGVGLSAGIKKDMPGASFVFTPASEAETERLVHGHEAHLGLTTATTGPDLTRKSLFESTFQTCVGRGHILYKAAKAGRTVPVAEVLAHPFVCPDRPILGITGTGQASDGWRDDKFPRRIDYLAGSLQLIEEFVVSGTAIAYLPDYYAEQIPVAPLKISGCPYTCRQRVLLIARNPDRSGWLSHLFI